MRFNPCMESRENLTGSSKVGQSKANFILRKFLMAFMHRLFRISSDRLKLFATYDVFRIPSKIEPILLIDSAMKNGIVIQGPIIPRVTYEICSYYTQLYPGIPIVLSTWQDDDITSFDKLQAKNFKIIQSVKPKLHGPSNINLQITSSSAGILELKAQGCSHILKTRTDVLLSNPSFMNYFISLQAKGKPNSLVFSSYNSFLFRLYSPTDQVMYGKTSDISNFWLVDLIVDAKNFDFPERYLFKSYLNYHGFTTTDLFDNYMASLRDYAVIADHELLGQIWNKGSFTSLTYRWRGSEFPNLMSLLSFWQWDLLQEDVSFVNNLNLGLDLDKE